MSCNKIQAASITPILAAGSVASPYRYTINISQRLCYPTCFDNTPVFAPKFSLVSATQVDADLYMVTIAVQGIISYVPCNGGCGCTKTQPLSQQFTIPVYSTATPTIAISAGATINAIAVTGCQNCSRNFVSETPLEITVTTTTPAA